MHELVVVTGGCSGFGRVLSQQYLNQFLDKAKPNNDVLHMLLTGRDEVALRETHEDFKKFCGNSLHVSTVKCDFASSSVTWLPILDKALDDLVNSCNIDRAILVNNAGTLGDISKMIREFCPEEVEEYFRTNLISCIQLRRFQIDSQNRPLRLVNISSLLAIDSHKYYGLYCTGKAARDMFHRVMSDEYDSCLCKTLNYAPGPMDNSMTQTIRERCGDVEHRKWVQDAKSTGNLVRMDVSALKLIKLLNQDTFISGSHVDYYDIE